MFWEKYKFLCENLDFLPPDEVARKIGIPNDVLDKWKKSDLPTRNEFLLVANHFKYSVDHLLKKTDASFSHKNFTITTGNVSGSYNSIIGNASDSSIKNTNFANEQATVLLDIFNNLDQIKRIKLLDYADRLKKFDSSDDVTENEFVSSCSYDDGSKSRDKSPQTYFEDINKELERFQLTLNFFKIIFAYTHLCDEKYKDELESLNNYFYFFKIAFSKSCVDEENQKKIEQFIHHHNRLLNSILCYKKEQSITEIYNQLELCLEHLKSVEFINEECEDMCI